LSPTRLAGGLGRHRRIADLRESKSRRPLTSDLSTPKGIPEELIESSVRTGDPFDQGPTALPRSPQRL
jgi:hypothetical protein